MTGSTSSGILRYRMESSDYIDELRRRLSPIVFSSAMRSERGVEVRVAALSADDEINLLVDAEERGSP